MKIRAVLASLRRWVNPATLGEDLVEAAIARPAKTIRLLVTITLVAGVGLGRLELRTDGHALVPADDPAVRVDAEVRRHFGLRDLVLAVLVTDHPDGIFNLDTVARLRELTARIAEIEGVGRFEVMSLATERRERLDPGTGQSFQTFLNPLPRTAESLEWLRQDLAVPSAQIYRGIILSENDRAVAVVAEVPGGSTADWQGSADRAAIVRRIVAVARHLETPSDRILVVGAPVAESKLGEHILDDLALMMPLALAVMAAVLWLGCRRLWGVLLGFAEVVACLVFTFGVMGWFGVPVYLTTAILPVLLVTLGLADEIHVFWQYQRSLAEAKPGTTQVEILRETMRGVTRPVVLTAATTAIGFTSFAPGGVLSVVWLGIFAALGVVFCLVWSLTVIPAALALLPASRLRRPGWQAGRPSSPLTGLLVQLWRRPALSLGGLAGITLLAGWAATRLEVYDSWLESFSPDSEYRRADEEVNRLLAGTHILNVELWFDTPRETWPRGWKFEGPLLDPAAVESVGEFEAFVRAQPGVGGVIGLHSQLAALSYFWEMSRATNPIPGDPYDLDRLLHRFQVSRGGDRRAEVVDDALQRTVLTVFVREGNYHRVASLMASIEAEAARRLEPMGVRLRFAGDLAVSQAMIPAIVRGQLTSLLLSLLGEVVVLWLLYRQLGEHAFRWTLLTLLPAAVSAVWVFGFMGGAGIPLGVATSMFCAITLGIGVDFAVHFVDRYRCSSRPTGFARAVDAIEHTGSAIVTNTLLNSLGFGLLALSRVPPNARLGVLVAVALLAACLLTLVGLGGVLATRRGGPSPVAGGIAL